MHSGVSELEHKLPALVQGSRTHTDTSAKHLNVNFAGSEENCPDSKGGTDKKSSSGGE